MKQAPDKSHSSRFDPGKFLMFLLVLLLLSTLSGYLMSKPSLVGRVGIDLFYRKYHFLSTWWKGALSVFMALVILVMIQGVAHFRLQRMADRWIQVIFLLMGLAGFLLTYNDFHSDRTHRWLKDRFHTGVYLFWCGWVLVSLFYLLIRKKKLIYENQRRYPGIPEEKSGY